RRHVIHEDEFVTRVVAEHAVGGAAARSARAARRQQRADRADADARERCATKERASVETRPVDLRRVYLGNVLRRFGSLVGLWHDTLSSDRGSHPCGAHPPLYFPRIYSSVKHFVWTFPGRQENSCTDGSSGRAIPRGDGPSVRSAAPRRAPAQRSGPSRRGAGGALRPAQAAAHAQSRRARAAAVQPRERARGPMSELRFNELRGEEVVYAIHRQDRTFLPDREHCPLDPTKPGAPETE